MRVLITGMCGFIGHHIAEYLLENTNWDLVGLDRIDATSTMHRLRYIKRWEEHSQRVKFVWHDLRAPINPGVNQQLGHVDAVIHMAASTHVDRSIEDPMSFVIDNVVGTTNMLIWWRDRGQPQDLFINQCTDEIFGTAPPGVNYREWDRYNSTNPYSAAKCGAEQMACAFSNTYRMKILSPITMNVIGERQHSEKFVPMVIRKVLHGEKVLIHADPTRTISGSRFYLHAANVGAAYKWVIENHRDHFPLYDRLNIVGEREITNLELAEMIAEIIGERLHAELVDFHSSRPGHDPRYGLDGTKLKELGFEFPMRLDESLERTVKWFLVHPEWLE